MAESVYRQCELKFDHGLPSGPDNHEAELAALYEKIGQLQVEVDFLKKSSKALPVR